MDAGHVADEADPAVPVRDQVGHPVAGAAVVVGEHHVRVDPPRRPVHEHRGDARLQLRLQVPVVVPGGDHHQPVHPPCAQGQHQFLLAVRVLGAGPVDQQGAVRAGHLLDGAAERPVEGVGQVLQHQADAGGTALAEHPCAVVAAETERVDGLLDAPLGLRGHPRLTVDHPGDGLETDAGPGGDVLHGRAVAVTVPGEAVCAAGRVGHGAVSCPVVHGEASAPVVHGVRSSTAFGRPRCSGGCVGHAFV